MRRIAFVAMLSVLTGVGTHVVALLGGSVFQRGGRGASPSPTQGGIPAQQTGSGLVNGILRNLVTKEPIASVNVLLTAPLGGRNNNRGQGTGQQTTTVTDNGGRFSFAQLAPGSYTVRAERQGYFGVFNQQLQQGAVNALVTVGTEPATTTVILELIPGGSIQGQVLDSNNRPLAGAPVNALREGYQDGHLVLLNDGNATTDDRGEFHIWGLAPGRFYLRVQTRPTPAQGQGIAAYYPGELDAGRARPIVIESGREFIADVHVPPVTPVKVSGRIGGVDPALTTVINYYLLRRDSDVWDSTDVSRLSTITPASFTTRGVNVSFELETAVPGRYDVIAVAPMPSARGSLQPSMLVGRTSIQVTDRNIEGLTVLLRPTFDLQVRFVWNGDPPAGNPATGSPNLRARELVPLALTPMLLGQRNTAGLTGNPAAAGFFPITEGRYFVDAPLGRLLDTYVADIRQGAKSLIEDGTVVVGNDPPEPVELILARSAGTVEGVVHDATNKPVASAQVVLVPDGRRRQNPLFYKTAIASVDGQFVFRGLAPGQYKVFAWGRAWENGWLSLPSGAEKNAQFLTPFEQFGRSVSINVGATVSNVVVSVIRENR